MSDIILSLRQKLIINNPDDVRILKRIELMSNVINL